MSFLIVKDPVDQSVINRADEVTVYNGTIPAGWWVGRAIAVEQKGKYNNGTANGRSFTVNLKLNGVLVTTARPSGTASSAGYTAQFQRHTLVGASTKEVIAVSRWAQGGLASDAGTFTTAPTTPGAGGTNRLGGYRMEASDPVRIAIDLGKPVQLEITIKLSTANATHEFKSMGVYGILLTNDITPSVRPDQSTHPRRMLRRAA